MPATAVLETTEKQQALIERLLIEKDVPKGMEIPGDRKAASMMIDWLFSQPKRPVAAAEKVMPGIYVAPNGDVIKVQKARQTDNVYAKVMVNISGQRLTLEGAVANFDFVYAPGLIHHITPQMRLTASEAEAFGIKTGRCMWCKKHLKDATSVMKGMGPVCRKKFE